MRGMLQNLKAICHVERFAESFQHCCGRLVSFQSHPWVLFFVAFEGGKVSHDGIAWARQVPNALTGDNLQNVAVTVGKLGLEGQSGNTAYGIAFYNLTDLRKGLFAEQQIDVKQNDIAKETKTESVSAFSYSLSSRQIGGNFAIIFAFLYFSLSLFARGVSAYISFIPALTQASACSSFVTEFL